MAGKWYRPQGLKINLISVAKTSVALHKAMREIQARLAFFFCLFIAPLQRQRMHACTKVSSALRVFFFFFSVKVLARYSPEETKGFAPQSSCGLWIDFSPTVARLHIHMYSPLINQHGLLQWQCRPSKFIAGSLSLSKHTRRLPPYIHSLFFFFSLSLAEIICRSSMYIITSSVLPQCFKLLQRRYDKVVGMRGVQSRRSSSSTTTRFFLYPGKYNLSV